MSAVLELRGVVVDFDGFQAVGGVDLTIEQGELRFLIGPNGAGKTSLIDVITGLSKPSEGTITFDGQALAGVSAAKRVRLGIGRSFQTPTVFESLTVVENLDLAETYRFPLRRMLRRRKGISEGVTRTLERIGLQEQSYRPAAVLSHGQKQWLEIGMLLVQEPKLVLLDEPVAGMSGAERQATGRAARGAGGRPHRRRHRARHGVPASLRPLGHRAPRGEDPERGERRLRAGRSPCPRGLPRSFA